MRRLSTCFIASVLFASLGAQPIEMLQLRKDGIAQWKYVDGDEFNAAEVNEEMWHKSYPWGRNLFGHLLHFYSDDNTYQQDGLLIMEAIKQDTLAKSVEWKDADETIDEAGTVNKRVFNYTSGMVCTKEKYYQGFFEAKLKTAKGRGYFPAFWLYGARPNEEIDIMEAKGERPNSFHVDMHCPDGCGNYKKFLWMKTGSYGGWIQTEQDLTEEFHLYGGEWAPGEIVFFLDDVPVEQWAGHLNHPERIIFNLAINGREGGGSFDGGIDETTPFPQTFEVDYLRIYERIDEGWEEKEKAKLNRKGRKKKKGKARTAKHARATARIFLEGDELQIETSGAQAELFSFMIMDAKGNKLAEPTPDEQGQLRYDLGQLNAEELWLISLADGFTNRTALSR